MSFFGSIGGSITASSLATVAGGVSLYGGILAPGIVTYTNSLGQLRSMPGYCGLTPDTSGRLLTTYDSAQDMYYIQRNSDYSSAGGGGLAGQFSGQISDLNPFGAASKIFYHGAGGDDIVKGSVTRDIVYAGDGSDLVAGNNGNDDLFGEAGNDRIDGQNGNDLIDGGQGNDTIYGDYQDGTGSGNDTLMASDGNDVYYGGLGVDTFDFSNRTVGVTVNMSAGTAADTGGANSSTFSGVEIIVGTQYNDLVTGSANADTLNGLGGNDVISGGGGADSINGGLGANTLTGGAAADSFKFDAANGATHITDFSGHWADHDVITIAKNLNGSGITDYATLMAHTTEIGGSTTITLGGAASIVLDGVHLAQLNSSDFLLF